MKWACTYYNASNKIQWYATKLKDIGKAQVFTNSLQDKDVKQSSCCGSGCCSTQRMNTMTDDQPLHCRSIYIILFLSGKINHHDPFEMGQLASQLLIEMIESKRPIVIFQRKILDTELIIRESSLKR